MNCKVLGTCSNLHILAISLHSLNKRNCKSAGKEWILTISLMASAPTWITENVYVRSPESKTLVDVSVLSLGLFVVLGASFLSYNLTNLAHKFLIKSCGKSDSLWEHCGCACSCHSVKSLVPPVVGWDAQSVNGRCIIAKLGCFLFNGHLGNKLFSTLSCFLSVHSIPLYLCMYYPIFIIWHYLFSHRAGSYFLPYFAFIILIFADSAFECGSFVKSLIKSIFVALFIHKVFEEI